MLIIGRKKGESLMIGDDIEVIVTEINGDNIKLGIKAPKETKILRQELKETVELNREAGMQTNAKQWTLLAKKVRKR